MEKSFFFLFKTAGEKQTAAPRQVEPRDETLRGSSAPFSFFLSFFPRSRSQLEAVFFPVGLWTVCWSHRDPDAGRKPWWTPRSESEFRGTKTWQTGTPGVERGAWTSPPAIPFLLLVESRPAETGGNPRISKIAVWAKLLWLGKVWKSMRKRATVNQE